jgi:hypothetical protein
MNETGQGFGCHKTLLSNFLHSVHVKTPLVIIFASHKRLYFPHFNQMYVQNSIHILQEICV